MQLFNRRALVLCLSVSAAFAAVLPSVAQVLTVQVGTPPPPPVPLVSHGDIWRWHKGTNAPVVGWQTAADASLDATWGSGPGGFGYSSDTAGETQLCATVLFDMRGTAATNYSTFYYRKSFNIGSAVDPAARLQLTMDFDDGFMVWLDGVFVTNRLVTGAPTEPLYTATASTSHESSHGSSGAAPEVYDLGLASSRLGVGTHTLAIVGLNQNKSTSTDFIQVADLALTGGSGGGLVNNGLYVVTTNGSLSLTGTNTVPGSTRLAINGDDVSYNAIQGTWSNTVVLAPGLNRLFIAALDASGRLLSNITQDIIYQTSRIDLGGTLASSVTASNRGTVVYVSSTVFVPTNMTLDIASGAVVLVSPSQGIYTRAGGRIYVHGTFDDRVFFNINGASNLFWGPLSGTGTNAMIDVQFADVSHAQVNATTNAHGLLQDVAIHDFDPGAVGTLNRPIMHCNFASLFEARRVHVYNYYECLVRNGVIQVEQCLFERVSGDALDFDSAQPGSFTRNCTYRHGDLGNVDAVDIGPGDIPGSTDTRIENSIMWDFPFDKGVSVGDQNSSHGIIVSNCLIYGCNAGVMSKDLCEVSVRNCTIVENTSGLTNYNKANPGSQTGGGITTNSYNNIVWNNITTIGLANGSQLYGDHNDLGNTNWPGAGNFDADPLFVDPARRNYRLQPGSPAIGTGRDGANLGVTYPLGGIPMPPLSLSVVVTGTNSPVLNWVDDSQNEDGVVVQRSANAVTWQVIATLAGDVTNYTDATASFGTKSYYRVQHTNYVAESQFSNLAATPASVIIVNGGNVSGTISQDTLFVDAGVFTVTGTINVASGATLFIGAGAQLRFNSGASLTVANGGRLMAMGTSNAPIEFTRSGTSGSWGGVTISGAGASPETHIEWANFSFNSQNPCIQVSGGTVWFDHLTFSNTTVSYLHLDGASFVVQNCNFPIATASFELVHGTGGIKTGGHGFFIRNFFGYPIGYNDVVDFTGGNRPGPIIHFIDNVFIGASDDQLDLDGTDAWVEHNIFLHCHKNGSPDTSSAVSGGPDNPNVSEITVIGNIMFDVDHAAMAKGEAFGGNFFTLINNTIVHQTKQGGTDTDAAVIAVADEGFTEAAGMYVEGNIIVDAEKLMRFHTNSPVTFTNNIIATNGTWTTNLLWAGPGGNNSTNDPRLKFIPTVTATSNFTTWAQAQVFWDWFSLQSNSPAIGGSVAGLDKGGVIPIGIPISGAPAGTTAQTNATLVVGFNRTGNGIPAAGFPLGSGYTHYRWRVDGGAWSAETPITTAISISNLTAGTHTVEVSGKRDSAIYQDDGLNGVDALVSRATWNVGALDTDGDGIPDDWEDAHGLNKLVNDAALDPDGDGLTNLQEFLAGTDPQLAGSTLKVEMALGGTNALLSFNAVSNKTYTVLVRDTLATNTAWQRLLDLPSTNVNRNITLTNAPAQPSRFFRVVTPIAP